MYQVPAGSRRIINRTLNLDSDDCIKITSDYKNMHVKTVDSFIGRVAGKDLSSCKMWWPIWFMPKVQTL